MKKESKNSQPTSPHKGATPCKIIVSYSGKKFVLTF